MPLYALWRHGLRSVPQKTLFQPLCIVAAINLTTVLIAGLTCAYPARSHAAPPDTSAEKHRREVKARRVVDGDTVVLADGDRVRVANINAPEIDEELGMQAREHTATFLKGKTALLEGASRDGYGRLVADLSVGGVSLAESLVRAGLAHVYLIPPVDEGRATKLLRAEAEARTKKLGIWSTARYAHGFHFTSFHANPKGNEAADPNLEYVRIANVSGTPKSLKGYTLTNRKGRRFALPDVVVPPGHTVMVHSGFGTPALDPKKQLKLYWNQRVPVWSNQGDEATLLGPDGSIVDRVEYVPGKKKEYPKDTLPE